MNQTATNQPISVITVVYNGRNSLEKTIQSVIGQSYPAIEYIIVDGGSTDGTVDTIKKYASRISAWKSEKDTGIYNAMNKGIGLANGKWCCFLNCGDTFVDNTVVQRIANQIDILPQPDIVYGNILVEKSDGAFTERIARKPCNIHRMYFCHQSAFIKTSVMKHYMYDEKYKLSADLKFFKQCYHDGLIFFHANFPVTVYDTSGVSNTRREDGLRENIAVIREIDCGFEKILFIFRLYFVIYWRKLTKKRKWRTNTQIVNNIKIALS